jgi:hypothetical protein
MAIRAKWGDHLVNEVIEISRTPFTGDRRAFTLDIITYYEGKK